MFSNTAYQALYQIIGLGLHSKFIEIITSESFFKGLIVLIFGVGFFITTLKFISRYIPGSIIERHPVPLSKFIKVVICLFLGLTILRVGSVTQVKDYKSQNWSENPYVQTHLDKALSDYRVSFVFDLLSGTAQEVTALISRAIDAIFAKGNSQLTAPDFFYKAIMYGGISTIQDQRLRNKIRFYTDECFTKILADGEKHYENSSLNQFFKAGGDADEKLSDIELELGNGQKTDCYRVKETVRQDFVDYASNEVGGLPQSLKENALGSLFDSETFYNYTASMQLANFYQESQEDRFGTYRLAEVKGTAGGIFQTLGRIMSWDGFLGLIGSKDLQGASEAAKRSQEFSEHLARAPHVAGFVQMLLIAVFPWLMFFVVAGRWKVLLVWFWIYFSVLLWAPLWTLLYHVMLGITMSTEVMQAFGELSEGVSLYSAELVNHRIYYMYSIYAWVQLLVATMTTGSVFMFLKPMLSESEGESKPEFLDSAQSAAQTTASVAKAVL